MISYTDWDRVPQMKGVLHQFESMRFEQVAALADTMHKDDRLAGIWETRVGALTGSEIEFKPAFDKRKAVKIAEEIGGSDERPGIWDTLFPRPVVGEMLSIGRSLGVAIGELVLDTTDSSRWMFTMRMWHPSTYRWNQETGRYWLQGVGSNRIELPSLEFGGRSDGHWIIWTPYGWRQPWRRALIRPLAPLYIARQWAYRDWSRFNEKHGQPTEVIYAPEGAPEDEKAAIFDLFANRGSEATFTLPASAGDEPKYSVELIEATSSSWQSFDRHTSKIETNMAILINGQNLTTEVKAGSFAAATVHEGVDVRKRKDDAMLGKVLEEQGLSHWVEWNHGDASLTPQVEYLVDDPEDELVQAQTMEAVGLGIAAMTMAGVRVDKEAIAVKHGIPLEAIEDEEVDATPGAGIELTPSAIGAIVTVNEARASVGMGPLLLPSGSPDPDGDLTVAEFEQKHGEVLADAAKAESGTKPGEEPPAVTPTNVPGQPPTGMPGKPRPPAPGDEDADADRDKRVLAGMLRRALIRMSASANRTVAGRRRAASYAEALERAAERRGKQALSASLEAINEDIAEATDFEDLRRRILHRYRSMSPTALRKVVEKAGIMAQLAGRFDALKEV